MANAPVINSGASSPTTVSISDTQLNFIANQEKSLFAGVLDGGEHEVFMQGSRLSQFMKSVEQVAGAISDADVDADLAVPTPPQHVAAAQADATIAHAEPSATPLPPFETPPEAVADVMANSPGPFPVHSPSPVPSSHPNPVSPAPSVSPDPWAAILDAGTALLQSMAAARSGSGGAGLPPITLERDPVTGQASVRLPLPDPAVLQRLAKAFEPWLR